MNRERIWILSLFFNFKFLNKRVDIMKESKSKKTRSISVSIIFSIILVLSGMTLMVSATHLQPNKFSGEVTLNGVPAPLNTNISAFIDGVLKGSITVEIAGKYGDFDGLKYLDVSGDDSDDGKTINFTIDGVDADRTAVWVAYEHPRVLDLSAVGAPTGDAPPTIGIKSPSSDQTFAAADITVSGSASDNVDVASVEVKLGSGSWTPATGTDSWSKDVILNLGPNTIYARAIDTSGLTAETLVTVYYNLPTEDTILPNISITSPVSDATFSAASITVSGKASDNEGLDRVEVKVGSGDGLIVDVSGTTASWSETVTLIKGPNTIYATAVDTSGNYIETSITVVYNPPDSTGETGSHGGSTGGSALSSGTTPTGADAQPVPGANVTSATSTPTMTGTAAPAATSAKESGAEPEEKKGQVPGFEAMFAIAGLLAVAYLLRKR
jgi:PGF-CTERM protein